MTQLTYQDLESYFKPLISKKDESRKVNLFYMVNGLPKDLNSHADPIYLAGGMPFENMFPIEKIDLKIRNDPGMLEDEHVTTDESFSTTIEMYEEDKGNGRVGLSEAMQYSPLNGLPQLLDLTKKLIVRINKPIYDEWNTIITCGSSDSLSKLCELLIHDGATMLIEEFTFTNILNSLHSCGGEGIPLKLNITSDPKKQGIDTEYMAHLLDNWSKIYPGKPKPKSIYTIATGQNPTGLTQCIEKRQRIYDICCKHNIIIIEDDPYGYLQLPKYDPENPMNNPYFNDEYSVDDYCKKILTPSYLTIDKEARVLRCETFSKVASPGYRMSFIAGNKFLIDRLDNITNMTTHSPNGISQAVLANTLVEVGRRYQKQPGMENASLIDGWIEWCMKIAGQYTHRRNTMFKYIYQQPAFKEKKIELIEPSCGMFVCAAINLKPEWNNNIKRVMDYLYCCLIEEGCLAILGYQMTVDRDFSIERGNFLRFTFAKANNPKVFQIGAERLNKSVERLFAEFGVDEKFTLSSIGFE